MIFYHMSSSCIFSVQWWVLLLTTLVPCIFTVPEIYLRWKRRQGWLFVWRATEYNFLVLVDHNRSGGSRDWWCKSGVHYRIWCFVEYIWQELLSLQVQLKLVGLHCWIVVGSGFGSAKKIVIWSIEGRGVCYGRNVDFGCSEYWKLYCICGEVWKKYCKQNFLTNVQN